MADRIVRIGGAAAHWMDSVTAVPQLLAESPDYIMLDYLSEGAMSVLARMLQQYPGTGFPPDVASVHIGPHLREIKAKGVRIVANGGGLNPEGAAAALRQAAAAAGAEISIAIVTGDDLRDRVGEFRAAGLMDAFGGGSPAESGILSINAYLGAFPIADALARGADVVLTGRVSDSALVLGPLIHEFGWRADDYDRLAAGTLAGHLLECGCHATGGTFTDWEQVSDGWEDMGFPIAECRSDGSFVVTKPDSTGGLVSRGTVAEQLLYEVSDPQAYFVADVVCDFSEVRLDEVGPDRVHVSGARGYPPTGDYKVTATYEAGWRSFLASPIVGFDAARKARRQGDALVSRVNRLLRQRNLPPLSRTRVEAIGAGDTLGAHAPPGDVREVVLRVVADHPMPEGAQLFQREQHSAMTGMSVGTTIAMAASALPLAAVASFPLAMASVPVAVKVHGGEATHAPVPPPRRFDPSAVVRPDLPIAPPDEEDRPTVPLIGLAWGRSGDKGGLFNVGIIARDPSHLPIIAATLTPEAVTDWFAHCFAGPHAPVERYYCPGIAALNFVIPDSLGGGILLSDRLDAVAKTMAQQLLAMPIPVPRSVAAQLRP